MPEFWEAAFKDKQAMWGFKPAASAAIANDFFIENHVRNVLIPGIGYGRNAQVFVDHGMRVAGIEISETAIELARTHFGDKLQIHHGSVTAMPFDDTRFDGIFCHGLVYLLDKADRKKLIDDCYRQLVHNGVMVFTAITQKAHTYGKGTPIGKDRFEMFGGVQIFFYNMQSIQEEFGGAGLIEVLEVEEDYPFYLVKCRKQ